LSWIVGDHVGLRGPGTPRLPAVHCAVHPGPARRSRSLGGSQLSAFGVARQPALVYRHDGQFTWAVVVRILALGAAGEIGRTAARVLAGDDRVTRLIVADRDARAATRVARALGVKAVPLTLDVTDRRALDAALRDCDLVVNTVGPFFAFGPPILSAAIDAACDYIDICDDPEPTLEMLAFDDRAKAAGVTALLGMGASPGVANLLAVIAGRELDTVETVITAWNINGAQSARDGTRTASAAVVHGMKQISGTIPVIRARGLARRPPLARIRISYPGIGPVCGRSFGHPEGVTLSRAFPGLRESTNMVIGDRLTFAVLSLLRWVIDQRIMTIDRAAYIAARLGHLMTDKPAHILTSGGAPPLFALATGTRQGSSCTVATALAQLPGLSMAANTAVPLAVATRLLAANHRPGVHTPETLLDPAVFFSAFASHCIGDPAPDAMTTTTRSWASPKDNTAALNASLLTALLKARAEHTP
jgi:saccharopine dehydrogenase-like NADP-dependent oxidoreductase